MNALIIEQRFDGGHFLAWVALVVRALHGLARRIQVALPNGAEESPQYRHSLGPLEGSFELVRLPRDRPAGRLTMVTQLSKELAELIDALRPDALYLPTGDGYVDAINLARVFGRDVVGRVDYSEVLLMRRLAAYGMPDPRIPRLIGNLSIRIGRWSRVLTIDPIIYRWLRTCCGTKVAARAVLAPDPIETYPVAHKLDARAKLSLPRDGRLVASLGMNDSRKGADLLLKAFVQSKLSSSDRLLLAGPITKEIRLLAENLRVQSGVGDRILWRDQYLSHEELQLYASASDLVAVPYRAVAQPSGIAIRALGANRPVLSNNKGWFAEMVPTFNLGWTCNSDDLEDLALAISNTLDNVQGWQPTARAKRLLEYQHPENFVRIWRQGLAERLGRRTEKPAKTWDWVVRGED